MDYQEKRRQLLKERNNKILELLEKGVPVRDIAKITGMHRTAVYKVIRAVQKSDKMDLQTV